MRTLPILMLMLLASCAGDDEPTTDAQDREAEAACGAMTIEQCTENTACRVIVGQSFDADRFCVGTFAKLGCLPADKGCDDAHTLVSDAKGKTWWLNDICVPAGFTVIEASSGPPAQQCDGKSMEQPYAACRGLNALSLSSGSRAHSSA